MSKFGPIVVLEDDPDDQDILKTVIMRLQIRNELVIFNSADDAFDYLKDTSEQPFIILSDINIPVENGIEFKRRIDKDEELRKKSIPFIFYSTSVDPVTVTEAYTKLTVQGFFKKPDSIKEIENRMKMIIDYWLNCKHPNSRD